MKKIIFAAMAMFMTINTMAQEKKTMGTVTDIKFSGYVMTQYQATFKENNNSNGFSTRMIRTSLEGRAMKDFYWKVQIQFNGNTSSLGTSPRVVDAFGEWQKYPYLKIKAGQFKRPFTFENPMNPIDQSFMSYSQNVSKLSGFADRTGEHSSNGRDVGVQVQGDFLKDDTGRNLLHYQVGAFNGQGINTGDVDQKKDIIGGLWVMPIKGMRIGAFGWIGSYARKGTWEETLSSGQKVTKSGIRSLDRKRYAISGEYTASDWTFRSEYIYNNGYGFSTALGSSMTNTDCSINEAAGKKADGFYALCIAPVVKKKIHVKARYDTYRPKAEWNTSRTQFEVGADYEFVHNLKFSAEFAHIKDRALVKGQQDYNMIHAELDYRF